MDGRDCHARVPQIREGATAREAGQSKAIIASPWHPRTRRAGCDEEARQSGEKLLQTFRLIVSVSKIFPWKDETTSNAAWPK